MLKFLAICSLCLMIPLMAKAGDNALSAVKTYIPNAALVGSGRMNYLMFQVYDATLYAPNGQYKKGQPVALSLHYLRSLEGRQIADRSAEEIRRQGFKDEITLATWHEQMRRIFVDVSNGTILTGIRTAKGQTVLLKDGKKIGTFPDPEFARYFFDIWLGRHTSEPELRKALLGKGNE